jgi:microcystin-dependent protein
MADPFVGEIRIFPFNFAPVGWALCQGQLMPISQNTALFSLIGPFYGGNGTSNFALPNLQGNVPVCAGQGPGLTQRSIGETGGETSVTLLTTQIPSHNHTVQCLAGGGDSPTPVNHGFAEVTAGRGAVNLYAAAPDGTTTMNAGALAAVGGSVAHNNMAPYLCLNFCIALQGVFPARS